MRERSHLAAVMLIVFALSIALIVPEPAFALVGAGPVPINVEFQIDYNTARGFDSVNATASPNTVPELVLRQGTTGTFNITFMSLENTAIVTSLSFGGVAPYDAGWYSGKSLPEGITYSLTPINNITLPPNSKTILTMQVSASPSTVVRSYDLSLAVDLYSSSLTEGDSYGITLTVLAANASITSTTINSTLSFQNQPQDLSQIGFQFYNQTEEFTICGPGGAISVFQTPARPIPLPTKFNMSYLSDERCSTRREHYLGALLAAHVPYLVNITATTAPVYFTLVQGTENDPSRLHGEAYQARVVLNESPVTSFNQNITVNQTGLYIFIFRVYEPLPIATVYFSVRPPNILVVTTTTTTTITGSNNTVTSSVISTTTSTTTTTSTLQNTVTSTSTATSTERVADSSIYAWAIGATAAAVVLAVVLLMQRRTK